MGYEIDMQEYHDDKQIREKELEKLKKEILDEAKKVVEDYVGNPSEISGSTINIHHNSPVLDTELNSDEPLYSGSRWTKVFKGSIDDAMSFVSKKKDKKDVD
tara:strand:- start:45 stop:350 length:306 start_codon:yes stop_codon:yes gene_type:complete